MTGLLPQARRLAELTDAREFADELLEQVLRLPVAKAMDLGSPQGFDRVATVRKNATPKGRAEQVVSVTQSSG